MKTLTVAMAAYRDLPGVWMTVQALRAYHGDWFDILVVDNAPERGRSTEAVTRAAGGKYVHRPDLSGTSKPRDACFKYADTEWVLVCDSHVLFEPHSLRGLNDLIRGSDRGRDLLTGPLLWDDGKGTSCEWRQTTPPGLWGVWDRPLKDETLPFEIGMQGLGVFAMRKDAWPGFHPLSRGFGGEEGYLHEKVRRNGGKVLCVPGLKWRHRFRDSGGQYDPTPYPAHLEDHVYNLLVQHRELGIDALDAIRKDFGVRLPSGTFDRLAGKASYEQPHGSPAPSPKPTRLLGVWYSDNTAPGKLLKASLDSVLRAKEWAARHGRHVAAVSAVAWNPFPHPVGVNQFSGTKKRSHGAIIEAIRDCLSNASEGPEYWDAVCMLEHDVLYPEDYFVRVADAFGNNTSAPVVSNLDYIGLNAQGWQPVKERHEPLHQLSIRTPILLRNLARAEAEWKANGSCLLEPQGERKDWVRLSNPTPGLSMMPSVHVNHTHGRFTSHGDVCYAPASSTRHQYWGDHEAFWPGDVSTAPRPAPEKPAGCGSCGKPLGEGFSSVSEWAKSAAESPSDFNEFVPVLTELARSCEETAEIVAWDKPSTVALVASGKKVTSYSGGQRAQWANLSRLSPDTFRSAPLPPDSGPVEPCDLLFIDTGHSASALYPLLSKNAPAVRKYLVIHCTETFGNVGDDGTPGVLHAIRTFVRDNKEWTAIRRDRNNNGLLVLSRLPGDREKPPGILRKALNYSKALARHMYNGSVEVPESVWEERVGECLTCEHRAFDACAVCGCPVEAKAAWGSEQCPASPPKWKKWPLEAETVSGGSSVG